MSIRVLPEVLKIEIKEYKNEYSVKLENMFVEKIEIDKETCVYKHWPTSTYELTGNSSRKLMEYAY